MKLKPQDTEEVDNQLYYRLHLSYPHFRLLEFQIEKLLMNGSWDLFGGEFLGKLEDTVDRVCEDET